MDCDHTVQQKVEMGVWQNRTVSVLATCTAKADPDRDILWSRVVVVVDQGLTSHIIGHIEDGFYGSKDPTNSVKALNEERS